MYLLSKTVNNQTYLPAEQTMETSIQGCLAAKGYYKVAVDVLTGQALIDALSKAQKAGAALK
jgi:hypothetical protein